MKYNKNKHNIIIIVNIYQAFQISLGKKTHTHIPNCKKIINFNILWS